LTRSGRMPKIRNEVRKVQDKTSRGGSLLLSYITIVVGLLVTLLGAASLIRQMARLCQ
jgi:hypothetical protein